MIHDNGILKAISESKITFKEAIHKWGNDPMWQKLREEEYIYIQFYPWDVSLTLAGEQWLKEQELHFWLLEQKLKDATSVAEYDEFFEYAKAASFDELYFRTYHVYSELLITEEEKEDLTMYGNPDDDYDWYWEKVWEEQWLENFTMDYECNI